MNVIVHPSPVGRLYLASDGAFLIACEFEPHDDGLAHRLLRGGGELRTDPVLARACAELDAYFAQRARGFTVPVAPRGTAFQRRVWSALREIPYGATWSYGELARHLGHPKAVRAVGQANARNPVSIFVPCHRVVGADGALTGFGGGLARKRYLLSLERGVLPLGTNPTLSPLTSRGVALRSPDRAG